MVNITYENYQFSAADISTIITKRYDFKENFNNEVSYFIFSTINQFKKNLEQFADSRNCLHLFAFYNKNNHWTLIYILKCSDGPIVYRFDSLNIHDSEEIVEEIKKFFSGKCEIIFYKNKTKKQIDGVNCGVFSVLVFLLIVTRRLILNYLKPFDFIEYYKFDQILSSFKKQSMDFIINTKKISN